MPDPDPVDPAALAARVESLALRVARLEREILTSATRAPVDPVTAVPVPVPVPPPPKPRDPRGPQAAALRSALLFDTPGERPVAPPAPPAPKARERERGPLRLGGHTLEREKLPVLAMALAGGAALLLGLLYFTWYSIQRGWIPPAVRVGTVATFGAAAVLFGARLVRRGQRSVGQALSGAGVGGWFGAILVGRHVHGFFGPTLAFVLLASGALAALVLASRERLRFLAFLAAWGAFLTPLVVGAQPGRVHEVLLYQLVVALLLSVLEARQRWVELGYFALLSTWVLYFAVGLARDPGELDGSLLAWGFVLLLLGHLQAARLLALGRAGRVHAALRTAVSLLASWAAVLLGAGGDHVPLGYGTLVLAICNACYAVGTWRVLRVEVAASPWRFVGCALAAAAAWIQVCAVPPLLWIDEWIVIAWAGLTAVATAAYLARRRGALLLPVALPYLLAYGRCLRHDGPVEVALAFALGLLPLGLGLAVRAKTLAARAPGLEAQLSFLLGLGSLTWFGALEVHLGLEPRSGWLLFLLLAPAALGVVLVGQQRTAGRAGTLLVALTVLTARLFVLSVEQGLLSPDTPFGALHLWHGGVLSGVAGLTYEFGRQFRSQARERALEEVVVDGSGLLLAGVLALLCMHLVSGTIPLLSIAALDADSLNQAGWSVVGALASLGLLVRGLFGRRATWRRAGIGLLFVTAGKLVVVDMVAVSMVWRVLSFMGLGICFLVGAFAYRRLGSWIDSERPTSPTP